MTVVHRRRRGLGAFADLPVTTAVGLHTPGEQWTLAAGQGCAPGYTEQMLANGNWTCIPNSDFQQIQQGDFTSLSNLPVAPVYSQPATFSTPTGLVPTKPATQTQTQLPTTPPQSPTSTSAQPTPQAIVDSHPANQFLEANPDSAGYQLTGGSGGGGGGGSTDGGGGSGLSALPSWLIPLALIGLGYLAMRKR